MPVMDRQQLLLAVVLADLVEDLADRRVQLQPAYPMDRASQLGVAIRASLADLAQAKPSNFGTNHPISLG
jgi:hypothetical protein